MDFLNQAIEQVRELLQSMTPAARATALLLVGVIGVSLGFLVKHQTASPDEYLFGGDFLQPRDLNGIEMAIAKADLNDFQREGNRIKVPRGQRAAYLAAIADAGAMPPNYHQLMDEALDLNVFTDRTVKEQRLKAAREQQLSMIISNMDGVDDATVLFDIQQPKGLSRKTTATAAVSIMPTAGEMLDARRMKRVRQLVASSIAGLKPEHVNVTNLRDGSMYGSGEEISSEVFDDPYYQTRINYEKYVKAQIQDQLLEYPGARVQVTAELDTRLEHKVQTLQPEGEGAALRESQNEDSTITTKDENGGRPGVSAQGPGRNSDQTTQAVVKNETTSTERHTDNFVGKKQENELLAGMVPDSVRATIGIPKSYLISVWKERERRQGNDVDQPLPANIDDQLQSLESVVEREIKALVAPLLTKEFAKDNAANVVVTFFESLTPNPVPSPSAASQAFSWASQHFSTISMTFVALCSLVMLRSLVKAIPPSEPTPAISAATLGIETAATAEGGEPLMAEGVELDEGKRPKLKLNKGPKLTDDLTDIVREDPDAAAAILRSWIGNAG